MCSEKQRITRGMRPIASGDLVQGKQRDLRAQLKSMIFEKR